MKRGHVGIVLVVLLVGVVGIGLLIAGNLREPTGQPILRLPALTPSQPIKAPSPQQIAKIPAQSMLDKPTKSGTEFECSCVKMRSIEGTCKSYMPEFFYSGTVIEQDDVFGGRYYQIHLDNEWICSWHTTLFFKHFVPGKDLTDYSENEKAEVCSKAVKANPECKISVIEKSKSNTKLKECVEKASTTCKSSFYQGELVEGEHPYWQNS